MRSIRALASVRTAGPLDATIFLCTRDTDRRALGSSAARREYAGVRRSMTDVHPQATFAVEGDPDWMVVTDDAVWVTSSNVNHVVRLDALTNQAGPIVTINKPCSGLAAGFGSIWVPSCGAHSLVRVDPHTGKIQARDSRGPGRFRGRHHRGRRKRLDGHATRRASWRGSIRKPTRWLRKLLYRPVPMRPLLLTARFGSPPPSTTC